MFETFFPHEMFTLDTDKTKIFNIENFFMFKADMHCTNDKRTSSAL